MKILTVYGDFSDGCLAQPFVVVDDDVMLT